MGLKRRVWGLSLFFGLLLVGLYAGGVMMGSREWQGVNLLSMDSLVSDKAEQKAYSIYETLLLGDDVVLFGTKEQEYKGPVLLDQETRVFVSSSKDNEINFMVEHDDGFQYTLGRRSKIFDGSVYVAVNGRSLANDSREDSFTASLYKVYLPNGDFESVNIPEKVRGVRFTPVFSDQVHGFLFPYRRSVLFETRDGGGSWTERHLPPGYARLSGIDRLYSGSAVIQPTTQDLFLSGHFNGDGDQPGSSPIYRLSSDNDDVQGWQEVARLEGYDINAMTFLDNGDLLILAYEGDRPEEGSDLRNPQILRWDNEGFEHLADLGSRLLFDPQTNTNLSQDYFVTGQNGLVVINGTSFKNENGDLPVYNVTYVSHDYGRTWERLNNGTATGSVWFDQDSGYLYKTTPFSSSRRRL